MSLSTGIAIIVILDVALLGFLAWMMSHPRNLTPHVSAGDGATTSAPEQQVVMGFVGGHAEATTIVAPE
jgi:hypothetical protein